MAAVQRRYQWVTVRLGGEVGPSVEELGGANTVTKAVIDGSAEDHASAAETGHLQVPEIGRVEKVNIWAGKRAFKTFT